MKKDGKMFKMTLGYVVILKLVWVLCDPESHTHPQHSAKMLDTETIVYNSRAMETETSGSLRLTGQSDKTPASSKSHTLYQKSREFGF